MPKKDIIELTKIAIKHSLGQILKCGLFNLIVYYLCLTVNKNDILKRRKKLLFSALKTNFEIW